MIADLPRGGGRVWAGNVTSEGPESRLDSCGATEMVNRGECSRRGLWWVCFYRRPSSARCPETFVEVHSFWPSLCSLTVCYVLTELRLQPQDGSKLIQCEVKVKRKWDALVTKIGASLLSDFRWFIWTRMRETKGVSVYMLLIRCPARVPYWTPYYSYHLQSHHEVYLNNNHTGGRNWGKILTKWQTCHISSKLIKHRNESRFCWKFFNIR